MDIDQIFGAFRIYTNAVIKAEKDREIRNRIADLTSKRCGNCILWMTNKCVSEKKYGKFRSMNSPACSLFLLEDSNKKKANILEQELFLRKT